MQEGGIAELTASYRKATGYGPLSTFLLAVVGFWLILLTLPNLVSVLAGLQLPAGMDVVIDQAEKLAGTLIVEQKSVFESSIGPESVVFLPVLVWLLVGASVIRSMRAKAWQPTIIVITNLVIGILAFPMLIWGMQVATWVLGVAVAVVEWFLMLLRSGVVRATGGVILSVIVLGGAVLVLKAAFRAKRRFAVIAAILAGVGLAVFYGWDFLARIAWPALQSIGSVLATVVGFVVAALLVISLWLVTLLVLAWLGSTVASPVRNAWGSGREVKRYADVAAGVGVAVSTLVMAESQNPAFAQFVGRAQASSSLGLDIFPNPLDLRWDGFTPAAFDPTLKMLFAGFNGAPDLAIVVIG